MRIESRTYRTVDICVEVGSFFFQLGISELLLIIGTSLEPVVSRLFV